MFRWWKDKKKPKKDRKNRNVEDDYGFRKRAIIVQEISGHTVIIKDDLNHPNILKFGAKCRARMPTPIQNLNETSSHIYDEIPELPIQRRFPSQNVNEADLVKDARARQKVDFRNAIEVGPYLIVPVVDPSCSNQDVEIFKRNECHKCASSNETGANCNCNSDGITDDELQQRTEYNPPWDAKTRTDNQSNTKIVLTRCVKGKPSSQDLDNTQPLCSSEKSEPDLCSLETFLNSNDVCRTLTESPGAESNSRTLTGTPVSVSTTPDHVRTETTSEVSASSVQKLGNYDGCPLTEKEIECNHTENVNSYLQQESVQPASSEADGTDTCCEYDLSTSGESDTSGNSDYDVYLSKIESNLKLKHNVRKIIKSLERTIEEETDDDSSDYHDCANDKVFEFHECSDNRCERDSITYVSSLSEYSSATSHLSDLSADRSASDDSSGYYECTEENPDSRDPKRDSRVNLERSSSVPDGNVSSSKTNLKKQKNKYFRHKTSQNRSNSFDSGIYKPLSHDQEMYLLPINRKGDSDSSSSGLRKSKSKPVMAPQPTPVYMDPYRNRSRSHNRLLGDLIRMNYDKQTFIQR